MKRLICLTISLFLLCGCGGGGGGGDGGGGTISEPIKGKDLTAPLAVSYIQALPWSSDEVHLYMTIPSDSRLYGVRVMRKTGSYPSSASDPYAQSIWDSQAGPGKVLITDTSAISGEVNYYRGYTYTAAGVFQNTQPGSSVLAQTYNPQPDYGYGWIFDNSGSSDVYPGDRIYALDPDGVLCGMEIVDADAGNGNYLLYCYFDDPDAGDNGGDPGDNVSVYIDGLEATQTPAIVFGARGSMGTISWTQEVVLGL